MNEFVITWINLYRIYFLLGLIIGSVINYPLIRTRFVVHIVFPVTGVFKYTHMENTVYANTDLFPSDTQVDSGHLQRVIIISSTSPNLSANGKHIHVIYISIIQE